MKCENVGIFVSPDGRQVCEEEIGKVMTHYEPDRQCERQATTKRKSMRFGDESKSEPLTVVVWFNLCADCARLWDEEKGMKAA